MYNTKQLILVKSIFSFKVISTFLSNVGSHVNFDGEEIFALHCHFLFSGTSHEPGLILFSRKLKVITVQSI